MATKIITTNVCDACSEDITDDAAMVSLHVRRVTTGAGRPRKGSTVDLHTECVPAWLPVPEVTEDSTEANPTPEPADAPKTTRKRAARKA